MPELHFHLTEAHGVPIYRQIRDQIVHAIRSGTLGDGDPLPSIRVLSADLLVAAVTIRKAYDLLEADGLISRRRGQGTFLTLDALTLDRLGTLDAEEALKSAVTDALRGGLGPDAITTLVAEVIASTKETP